MFLLAPTAQVASYAGEIEDAKEKVRKNPDDAYAHTSLGYTYAQSGKRQEAIESFKKAIRIDPRLPEAHYALGGGYLAEGDRSSALGEYEILKELDTEWANKLFNLIYRE